MCASAFIGDDHGCWNYSLVTAGSLSDIPISLTHGRSAEFGMFDVLDLGHWDVDMQTERPQLEGEFLEHKSSRTLLGGSTSCSTSHAKPSIARHAQEGLASP